MTHSLAPTSLTASAKRSPELTSVPDLQENVIHAGCCSSLAEEIEIDSGMFHEVQNAWRGIKCHESKSHSPAGIKPSLPSSMAFAAEYLTRSLQIWS